MFRVRRATMPLLAVLTLLAPAVIGLGAAAFPDRAEAAAAEKRYAPNGIGAGRL